MTQSGHSTEPTPTSTEVTATERALLKALAHLRAKVAMHVDNYVEPDDIDTDDAVKNTER